jgi:hypothetical protein
MTNARELSNRLSELLKRERHALAEFLIALSEFDHERHWQQLGHSSLFNYLHRDLGLSKGAAFYRMTAAQLIQRHPEVVEPLRDGRLCFTSVVELSKVTAVNIAEVLPRFFHVSKSQAKEVSAELNPTPAPTRTIVTAARAPTPALAFALAAPGTTASASAVDFGQLVHPDEPPPVSRAMTVEPKTAEQSRVHITVPRSLLRKLEAARDALSHSKPNASEAEILEAGLDLLLERHARRKGLVKKPRKAPVAPRQARGERGAMPPASRYIPAHVRREVWERDQGRCQFPLEGGGVCGSTYKVELDHVVPLARGGPSTTDNIRCACGPHNLRAAREAFGDHVMDRYTGWRWRTLGRSDGLGSPGGLQESSLRSSWPSRPISFDRRGGP